MNDYCSKIDLDVRVCADAMISVFHAHQQFLNHHVNSKENMVLKFDEDAVFNGKIMALVPYTLTRTSTIEFQQEWGIIIPVFGKTGLKSKWLGDWRYDTLVGMVGYNKIVNAVVISFKGTRETREWFNNLTVTGTNSIITKDGITTMPFYLHNGYLEIFESCISSLTEALKIVINSAPENFIFLVTGHSLGGSVAGTAIPWLNSFYPDKYIRLVTFGAPMVGGKDYNNWLVQNHIKAQAFVRNTDPAVLNPSGYFKYNYLGDYILLPDYGDYMIAWPAPHDSRRYLRAVYECLNHDISKAPTYYTKINLGLTEINL